MNYQDLVTEFFHMNADSPFPNHAQMIAIRQFASFLEERAAQQLRAVDLPTESRQPSWADDGLDDAVIGSLP